MFLEALILIIFFLVIGGVIASSVLTRHRERMTMLDKGMKPEEIKQLYDRGTHGIRPLTSLKWGVVFLAIGLAVITGMWMRENFFVPEGIYPALISLFGGIGLIVFYTIARKKMAD